MLIKVTKKSPLKASSTRIAVTKKLLPRAVDRNKLRRRIKAALRAFALPEKGVELLIVPSAFLSFAEIEEKLETRLSRWKL